MNRLLLALLVLTACGPVVSECHTGVLNFYSDQPGLDCSSVIASAELAQQLITEGPRREAYWDADTSYGFEENFPASGLLSEQEFYDQFSGLNIYISAEILHCGEITSGGCYKWPNVYISGDLVFLAHEMLHHHEAVTFTSPAVFHEGWDKNGYKSVSSAYTYFYEKEIR